MLMASASAGLARFGHHGLLDQHVPAARGGGNPVLGMKRRGCGNHHAVGGGIDLVHAREIANCLIRMKVGIRLDHPDEVAFRAGLYGSDVAQADQAGAHDEE